jgi:hypothetical protein
MLMHFWVLALHEIDVIWNCRSKTKILSHAQVEDLRSGVRHNNRAPSDEKIGLPCEIVEELSEMVKYLGRKMVEPSQPPIIGMASVSEFLDRKKNSLT